VLAMAENCAVTSAVIGNDEVTSAQLLSGSGWSTCWKTDFLGKG